MALCVEFSHDTEPVNCEAIAADLTFLVQASDLMNQIRAMKDKVERLMI